MLPIQKMLVKYNFNKGGNKIKYIVIHDTGNPGAPAINHYKYFGGGDRGASAHYFIDEENIIQIIEDGDRAWHCGDGKGKCGISNSNSIGIEMCLIGNDIEKEMSNVIDLTVYLMKKYNISIDKVVRHYDASRKSCPNVMSKDNWTKWWKFKALVELKLRGGYKNMTKEEVVNIVKEMMHPNTSESSDWAKEAWRWATEKGIVDGTNPKGTVTREQVITMIYRFQGGK